MLRNVFILIVCILGLVCGAVTAQKKSAIKRDSRVMKLIASLPEVVQLDHILIHHKRHVIIMIDSEPTKKDNYYRASVGEDNGMNFVSHYKFVINAKTNAISYWDVRLDKVISLETWRNHGYKVN